MLSPRLAGFAVVLVAACAAWESSAPNYAAPPEEGPAPSTRYAPPPPPPVEPPVEPEPVAVRMAIASVQLLQDCPEPVEAGVTAPQSASRSVQGKRAAGATPDCEQSTVQLTVHSGAAGRLRVEAVRVLAATSKGVAGTSTLRGPKLWTSDGTYVAWDERVVAEKDLQISYKLGELDLARAGELNDPQFNTYAGPFLLELEVSIDGRRQTLRSPEFRRLPTEMMMT